MCTTSPNPNQATFADLLADPIVQMDMKADHVTDTS